MAKVDAASKIMANDIIVSKVIPVKDITFYDTGVVFPRILHYFRDARVIRICLKKRLTSNTLLFNGAVYRFLKTLTKFVHRVTVRQSPAGYPGIAGDGSGSALCDVPSTNAAPTQPARQGRRASEYTAFLQI